ncbi:SDR family oxidoreductase [Gemmobacter denitrificans]|uniref:SDR family oxidoreductase n=1 Tax=Gemmobacter denitrificans TaxID=3123040 RepID=A0ABU8BRC6_9RHOB
MKVLVLGADGFIGRHIAFALRDAGHEVIASARRVDRLQAMGFRTLRTDLTDPASHAPGFWADVRDCTVVNAAGLLAGTEAAFAAVYDHALRAVLAAVTGPSLHVSAVGIEADTPFARWRRVSEQVALDAGAMVLRPGLVMADTSYGGTSALRGFAALPFVTPVAGTGTQPFNPIHAADLAAVIAEMLAEPQPGVWEVGGPEVLTQADLATSLRRWLGLRLVPVWRVPDRLARLAGRVGDVLRLGPISSTALRQLEQGVQTDPAPLLARLRTRPRGFSAFQFDRPAGTQDLWQARLYLLKPLIRLTLAVMWLASAALGLFLPGRAFLQHLEAVPEGLALIMARAGGLADLALGLALLRDWRPGLVARAQIALVLAYTAGLTLLAPDLWFDPFGGLLKNLPVLALILVHLALVEER